MKIKVAVLGLGTAGITFITELRRLKANLSCDITLFEKRGAKIFHPCSIPEAVEGKINPENLIEPINLKDIKVVQAEVLEVEPEKREISFLKNGGVEKMSFDFIFISYNKLSQLFGSFIMFMCIFHNSYNLVHIKRFFDTCVSS
jgi:NADH dehydrogenase FAD-containing subunit